MKRKTKSASALTKLRKRAHALKKELENNYRQLARQDSALANLQRQVGDLVLKVEDLTKVRDKLLRAIVFTSMKDVHQDVPRGAA